MNQNRTEKNLNIYYLMLILVFTSVPSRILFGQKAAEQAALSLPNAVRMATQNNPGLLSEKESLAEIEAQIGIAKSDFYPSLSFSSDYRRFSGVSNSYSTGFTARQYLFRGGKSRALVEKAKLNYQVSEHQYQNRLQNLVLRVTEAYYRLLQRRRLVRVAEQTVERAVFHLKQANARFESGLASRSDILKAKVERSNANLNLIRATNDELAAKGFLNNLLGIEANTPLSIVDDLGKEVEKTELYFDSLSQSAIQNRPEVKQMASRIQWQKSNIKLARSDYFPNLSANGSYDWSGASTSSLDRGWFVGLSLDFPLFNGFSTKSNVAQERAALRAAERNQEATEQQVVLDVWNAYLAVQEAKERIDNTEIFLENARENQNIAEGEYREGIGSMIEVIDAQTAYVTAEESYIEALADCKIALADLRRATGTIEVGDYE